MYPKRNWSDSVPLPEYFDEYKDQELASTLKSYYKMMHVVGMAGKSLFYVTFAVLVLLLAVPRWRHQEDARLLVNLVFSKFLHELLLGCRSYFYIRPVTFYLTLCYAEFLLCIWMFLFIFYLRKTVTEYTAVEIYPFYIYIGAYVFPILVVVAQFLACTYCDDLVRLTFYMFVLSVNLVVWLETVLTVVNTYRKKVNRKVVRLVIRFLVLYSLVIAQTIATVLWNFIDPYSQDLETEFLVNIVLSNVGPALISVSVFNCVVYKLFN